MQQLLYSVLCFILSFSVYAQKTFCEGWEEGYTSGKKAHGEHLGIIPICPIAHINYDTYEDGFSRGYEAATGSKAIVFTASDDNESDDDRFCSGWEDGYEAAMIENKVSIYTTPICPIAPINGDSYQDGYLRGRNKAFENLNKADDKELVGKDDDATFCDGWEDGYQAGLQQWAIEHKTSKESRMTPICPIAGINEDGYISGFTRGMKRALEDMD